ncbi:hypothetical protein [Tessaracoccus palaemonis]|uniref:Uncharacterized protein n=1 Tax=Tessaracoccus palaemonis TaxID=2829499 RepID=A0ABX8SGM6_9ACTN|nr:hypothetical protein [Tessaracoccus palaemonis]QXT62558.1 hypothetical protein KDB89_12560 [Tessaracoccus palaemonis]
MEYALALALVLLLVLVTRPWWGRKLTRAINAEGEAASARRIATDLDDVRGTVDFTCDLETATAVIDAVLEDRRKWTKGPGHLWHFRSIGDDDLVLVAESTRQASHLRVSRVNEVELQLQGVREWTKVASAITDAALSREIDAQAGKQPELVRDQTPTTIEVGGMVVTANTYVWRAVT